MDVYIVNSIHAKISNFRNLLNPVKNGTKSILLLFEDFDRFIAEKTIRNY